MSYFSDIRRGVVTTLRGLRLTARHVFTKPVTIQYPEQTTYVSPYERGFHEYEPDACIICGSCAKVCPVDCIDMAKEGRGKSAVVTRFAIDYSKCIFCGLCLEPCPTDCIHMGTHFDLSTFERHESIVIDFVKGEGPWRTVLTSAPKGMGVRAHE